MAKTCLITQGQPSINPRLVKEADALAEAGHDVHVLCSHVVSWADEADKKLLAKRKWSCLYVGGDNRSLLHTWTRLRHGLVRRFSGAWSANSRIAERVLTRVTPELIAAAVQYKAELYIAHYSGALVAAAQAARTNGQQFAFDAEDFESGYYENRTGPQNIDRLIEEVERTYLQGCCYVTAASPQIASAYHAKYGIATPTTILNVFSVAERPLEFRTPVSGGPLRLYWFSQTIGPGRGLEDVIRAMGKMRDCRVELHLRGKVRPEYWKHLLNLATTEGVTPDALFLLGPCAPDELIREAAEFDVGLALEHPSNLNKDLCLSNKLFSYLLAGNAIAATATAAQKDILATMGGAGFLYPPGDINALAQGLRIWIQDRATLLRARQDSWFWGTQRFNWEIEKGKFLQVIDGVLSKRECVKRAG